MRRVGRRPRKKRTVGNKKTDREYGILAIMALEDDVFKKAFRMSREAFFILLDQLKLNFFRDTLQARRSSGSEISLMVRLAVTLRFLAGASYIDMCMLFGLSFKGTLFHRRCGVIWPTIEALNNILPLQFDTSAENLKKTAEEFASYSYYRMNGCVMAIDGIVIHTRRPRVTEVNNVIQFRNRKCCWGLVVLAGCDARCRFTMFKADMSGGTNDCVAYSCSHLSEFIHRGLLPKEYYVIGDEGFVNSEQFLTPFSQSMIRNTPHLANARDSFNFHLSSMRQCIERAFGQYVKRWGIFWRPLSCAFRRWPLVCLIAAKLHNFCIDYSPSIPFRWDRDVHSFYDQF